MQTRNPADKTSKEPAPPITGTPQKRTIFQAVIKGVGRYFSASAAATQKTIPAHNPHRKSGTPSARSAELRGRNGHWGTQAACRRRNSLCGLRHSRHYPSFGTDEQVAVLWETRIDYSSLGHQFGSRVRTGAGGEGVRLRPRTPPPAAASSAPRVGPGQSSAERTSRLQQLVPILDKVPFASSFAFLECPYGNGQGTVPGRTRPRGTNGRRYPTRQRGSIQRGACKGCNPCSCPAQEAFGPAPRDSAKFGFHAQGT